MFFLGVSKMAGFLLSLWIFIYFYQTVAGEVTYSTRNPCTYFGANRLSSAEGNLVNCSWYSGNSCCKRTEVTSVFASMYALSDASPRCSNMLNYMMCYFCSPEQHLWYDGKVRVCGSYCRELYEECLHAKYRGTKIGSAYSSGEDFCLGQSFQVQENTNRCFDFNPHVFGSADKSHYSALCLLVMIIVHILSEFG